MSQSQPSWALLPRWVTSQAAGTQGRLSAPSSPRCLASFGALPRLRLRWSSWWRTGWSSLPQSMGSQRVGHDWATEPQAIQGRYSGARKTAQSTDDGRKRTRNPLQWASTFKQASYNSRTKLTITPHWPNLVAWPHLSSRELVLIKEKQENRYGVEPTSLSYE